MLEEFDSVESERNKLYRKEIQSDENFSENTVTEYEDDGQLDDDKHDGLSEFESAI